MRRITETDLANTAPLTGDLKVRALRGLKAGWGPFSYDPTKTRAQDIFNAQPTLFGAAAPTGLSLVRKKVIAACKSEDEIKANVEITECLCEWATQRAVRARLHHIPPYLLSNAVGISYSFWLNLVLIVENRLVIPFLDPRRKHQLTPVGLRFVFSMMHHRARVLDPDLADAELAVFQFPPTIGADGTERRILLPHFAGDTELYSFDELEKIVGETYDLWQQVLTERSETARKSAGKRGTLI